MSFSIFMKNTMHKNFVHNGFEFIFALEERELKQLKADISGKEAALLEQAQIKDQVRI